MSATWIGSISNGPLTTNVPRKIPTRRPRETPTRKEQNKRYDRKRIEDKPWRKWYKTAHWLRLRKRTLNKHPFCVRCKKRGIIVPS